jgi:hypothetical protein
MLNPYEKIRKVLRTIDVTAQSVQELDAAIERIRLAIGRVEVRQNAQLAGNDLASHEFAVFSQWGEDGIISYLTRSIRIERPLFVEIGVEDYHEANTRFLLQNSNWSGLVIDASESNVERIRHDDLYWRHNLKALFSFVDVDNINELLSQSGIHGDIGLLSVDIDGNDYWVWQAIIEVCPRIVVCEYNSLYGPDKALAVPYDPGFQRTRAHFSNLYAGASIAALARLGNEKGYRLVGSNGAGNNAFFVREDLAGEFRALTPPEAYVQSQFRESRDEAGNLTFLGFHEAVNLIAGLPVVDIDTGETIPLPASDGRL